MERRKKEKLNLEGRIWMRQFKIFLGLSSKVLELYFTKEEFIKISQEMVQEFQQLIPQIPFVGGKNNEGATKYIHRSAMFLVIYRILERKGFPYLKIGEISYKIFEEVYNFMQKPGEVIFSQNNIQKMRRVAKDSQDRKFKDDWVMEFVESNEREINYGLDYIECGIYKFYRQQGLEKYARFICLGDYAMARSYGYGLKRTQTIANGANSCNFRFIKGEQSPKGWPPDDLPEFNLLNKGN